MISQIAIMIFGASAIWFVGRKEEWKRWGYILGILGQPFWFYSSFQSEQWGIFAMCFIYTYSWGQGILNYWIRPRLENKQDTPAHIVKVVDRSVSEILVSGKTYLYNGRHKDSARHSIALATFMNRMTAEHPEKKYFYEYGNHYGVWCYKIELHNL